MTTIDEQARTMTIRLLVEEIRPSLAGQKPEVIGAVLGELVALYIAGHHPSHRREVRQLFLELIDHKVPIALDEIISDGTVPKEWKHANG